MHQATTNSLRWKPLPGGIHKYIYIYVCMCIYIYVYMYIHTYTCVYICTYTRIHMCMHAYIYLCIVHVCTYICIHTYACIQAYKHTHIHMHTRAKKIKLRRHKVIADDKPVDVEQRIPQLESDNGRYGRGHGGAAHQAAPF